jgi:hypothetical protein
VSETIAPRNSRDFQYSTFPLPWQTGHVTSPAPLQVEHIFETMSELAPDGVGDR